MVGALAAAGIYLTATRLVPRPRPTPLDFLAATAPGYLCFLVAVASTAIAVSASVLTIPLQGVAWGYAVGVLFSTLPIGLAIVRREWIHQFEIKDLYSLRQIVPREILLCAVVIPAIAVCEELIFRTALPLPTVVVVVVQWLVYTAGSRSGWRRTVTPCAFLAALHFVTGSLGIVIGAHAAMQTLGGRLRSPGIFSDVYPLLEQAKSRTLGPDWEIAVVEGLCVLAVAALA